MSSYQTGSWGSWDHPIMDGGPIQYGSPADGGTYQRGPYMGPPLTATGQGPIVTRVPAGSPAAGQTIDPTTGLPTTTQTAPTPAGGFDISSLLNAQVFGIPVLYIALGLAAYFLFFKKGR